MGSPHVAVVGSANIDFVRRVPRLPRPGETLRALSSARYRGGKGANQAVAAARLGADVRFYGSVGNDENGDLLLAGFAENGVDASAVQRFSGRPTGTASIWVSENGDNAIVVDPGANAHVEPEYVSRHLSDIADADIVLLQFEIPYETVLHLIVSLPSSRPIVALDPAPPASLHALATSRIGCVTPNQQELRALSGEAAIERGLAKLRDLGIDCAVCTLGAQGACALGLSGALISATPPPVQAVDSTACGDAFAAALALARFTDREWTQRALDYACAAGALAATQDGAWPSLPTGHAVLALLGWPESEDPCRA